MKYFLISIFGFALILTSVSKVSACENKGELKKLSTFELKQSACHDFAFQSESETFLQITARQSGVDIEIGLFENGNRIKSADSENLNSGFEFLTFVAKPNAEYVIRVGWLDDGQHYIGNEGSYTLETETRIAAGSDKIFIAKLDEAKSLYDRSTTARLNKDVNAVNDYLAAIAVYKSLPPNQLTKYKLFLTNYYLGVSYNLAKNYAEAIRVLETAAVSAGDNQDVHLENLVLKELGAAYLKIGNYLKAGEVLEKASVGFENLRAEKVGDRQTLPSLYIARAEVLLKQNKAENAVVLLEHVRSNFNEPFSENMLASLKLADVYLDLGNQAKAEQVMLSLDITKNVSDYIKGIYHKISGKLSMNRDKEKALDNFNKARAFFNGNDLELNETKLFIGNTYLYAKDFDSAKNLFEESKQYFELQNDKTNLAQVLNNLGVIDYRQHDLQNAIANVEHALSINIETQNELNKARNQINLMYFYNDLKNTESAIFYGKWAINTIREVKYDQLGKLEIEIRENFQESFNDAFRKLSELFIKEGRIGEAEQILRFIKEKEYHDYMRGGDKINDIDFTRREKEILDKITDKIKKKSLSVSEQRSAETDSYASPTKQLINELEKQKIDVSEIVFVSTIVNKDSVSIIATTAKDQKVYSEIIPRENLGKMVFEFREAVSNVRNKPHSAGEKLYNILVKPLEKDFLSPKIKKIVWSLDGVLRYVSMPALFDGKNYLVERFASIQIALASEDKILKPKIRNLSAIGLASSKAFENLSDLPVAKNELDCIFEDDKKLIINSSCEKGIIKGKKVADENFTREVFENALREFELIHLTSHFVLQSGDNTKSFLLLGGGNDRKYTMQTFSKQQLQQVDTLIMSACDTANFSYDGSEFESFAAMAQKQGAGTVVGTLWSVADHSTSKFMTEFYRAYEIKKLDKAGALRSSQMFLLKSKKYSHPFYWGSFILYGNWK